MNKKLVTTIAIAAFAVAIVGVGVTTVPASIAKLNSERLEETAASGKQKSTKQNVEATNYISETEAKSIALKHAGFAENEVTFIRVELDKDDGRAEYEVEFHKDSTEYDYEIDAISGKVLSFDFDVEGYVEEAPEATKTPKITEAPSEKYIGKAAAKKIALKHAKLTENEVTFVSVKLEKDDGRAEYEVEFYKGNTEYDYEIDAISGKILSYDHDAEGYDDDTPKTTEAPSEKYIGKAAAKKIALKHAKLTENEVTFVSVKLEKDDGRAEYEVEFYKGSTEYDYEIDAISGKILSYDHDAEGYDKPEETSTDKDYIGDEKAKAIAIKHAGVNANDVIGFKLELDMDDGRAVYEIEFTVGNVEYEYEIDAISGKIISFDKEVDD